MATTALPRSRTINLRHDAVQCEQLKDNSGNAVNVADLANFAPGNSIAANGSSKTLTSADNGKTFKLDTAAGTTTTLPAASGSGVKFKFVVTVPTTSSGTNVIQVANGSDTMKGTISAETDTSNVAIVYHAGATDDTITLNHGSKGGTVAGEWIEVQDLATNVWAVRGQLVQSGTEGTPFSAAVS